MDYERPKEAFIRSTVTGQKIITLSGSSSTYTTHSRTSSRYGSGTGSSQTYDPDAIEYSSSESE